MPLFERSASDILQSAILDLTSNSRVTKITPGSKARAILESVSKNLNSAYKTFDINLTRAFLSGATGQYLDLIGELLNTHRLGTTIASASATAKVVKFYVASGVFGDINGGSSITIPAGTIVSTQENNTGILYRVVTGVTCSFSASEQFISVEALGPGETSNVGQELLSFHNFTGYSNNNDKTLLVKNVSSIFNGSNIEDDINYKFRISRAVLTAEAANQTAVLLTCLSIPGVSNVVLQNRHTGIGTFKVLIKSITPSVSPGLIEDVQSQLSLISALGIYPVADKPKETGMQFVITIKYNDGVSAEEQDAIEDQVRVNVTDYVNNLDIGESFILDRLVSQVISTSSSIKDIGAASGVPIDQMFIYKETRLRDSKTRNTLLDNYVPRQDERIIIEPSLSEPITIFRA